MSQRTQSCNLHDDGAHVLEDHPLALAFHGGLAWSHFRLRTTKTEYFALTGTDHTASGYFVPFQFLAMLGPGFFRSMSFTLVQLTYCSSKWLATRRWHRSWQESSQSYN